VKLKTLILVGLLTLASPVFADTVNVSWTPPTAREDGTAMPLSEIQHYRLSWTLKGVAQTDKIATGTSNVIDTGTVSGRVCVTLRTVDTDGLESAPTTQVCRNSRPKAPTSLELR
jgi:hypothetical protein